MSDQDVFPVLPQIAENSGCDSDKYQEMYGQSIQDPEAFWATHGKRIDWIKPYTKIKEVSFKKPEVSIKWCSDGTLNASYNCLDRHL